MEGEAGKPLCACIVESYLPSLGRSHSDTDSISFLQVLALPGFVWKQLTGEEVSWSKDFPAVDSVLVRGRLCLSYSLWHSARH